MDKSMHDLPQAQEPDPGRYITALGLESVVKPEEVKGVSITTEGSTQVATVTMRGGQQKVFSLMHGEGEKWKERKPEAPADAARRGFNDRSGPKKEGM